MTFTDMVSKSWSWIVSFGSFEWIMTRTRRPNSGAIVLLRALLISVWAFMLVIAFINLVDPTRSCEFSLRELRTQLVDKLPWAGAIFGAAYAALYARFASQWSYLADLYNLIKQTEASACTNDAALAEWKAGFIEDAQVLHLATKESFVSVIREWGKQDAVKDAFKDNVPGGTGRLDELLERVNKVYDVCSHKYPMKKHSGNGNHNAA